ncbi:hypothetical protein BDP27DRAFT_1336663 [Rhodocollybia butyracea]|uniref:Uncharacterized protein n=1 Tax=Rhodocollybia butyracea TaxID=206335 RepID=A0A9P5PFX2_9AGAR|nr:hypothetical protein BDP27DRAFT_1336663 [Rhodocollybia butyracea]
MEFHSQMFYYPLSDSRDTPWTLEQFAQATRNRCERYSLQAASSRPVIVPPKIAQISGGFLRENGRYLYTVKHALARECLDYARTHWRLQPDVPDEILALAALETFLNPFDPVHWLFWGEQKDQSAKLVQSHIGRQYPAIYHPLSWSILDWRFRLFGIHSKQLPQVLCHMPWYDLLVLPTFLKDTPRGPVLRKRKVPLVNLRTSSLATSEPADDLEELPAKRLRASTRARPVHTPTETADVANLDPSSNTIITPTVSDTFESQPNTRLSRNSPQVSISTTFIPPDFSRTRSSSRLSAQTLVDDSRDRSPSTSSATTAAESSSALTAKAKGKRKAVDELVETEPRIIAMIDIVVDDDTSSVANSFNDDEVEVSHPRITRSRSGASSILAQRTQLRRNERANGILPYPSEKSARGGSTRSIIANMATPEPSTIAAPTSKKGRQTKNSRR